MISETLQPSGSSSEEQFQAASSPAHRVGMGASKPGTDARVEMESEAKGSLISLEQVTLGYGRRVVLRDVEISIEPGQFWCFLGPNGEGKTTLIKALLGAVKPMRGKIRRKDWLFRRRKVSYVPQRLDLNPALPMSVREFVLTGMAGLSSSKSASESRLDRSLELVGLRGFREKNYWTLSGGQKQRTLVARALVRDPRLLIVDEPTAGLDFAAIESVLKVMRDLYREYGVTVVFVTHDLDIAAEHATHLAFFRNGKVTAGPKETVLTDESLHTTFGVPVLLERTDAGGFRIGSTREQVGP